MSANIPNKVPFLRTSRHFPTSIPDLVVELTKMYNDISMFTNARTIGIFATNMSLITGESWFVNSSSRQQTFRKLFTFTSAGNIPHGINLSQIAGITRIYGTFTNNANPSLATWYPLPYVDQNAANNQVSVVVNGTNIVITAGGGAPPTIVSGYVIIEYLANP